MAEERAHVEEVPQAPPAPPIPTFLQEAAGIVGEDPLIGVERRVSYAVARLDERLAALEEEVARIARAKDTARAEAVAEQLAEIKATFARMAAVTSRAIGVDVLAQPGPVEPSSEPE